VGNKIRIVFLVIIITLLLAGCSSSGASSSAGEDTGHIDVDLTALSETVLSAEIMSIVMNSDDYLGKIIKVRGTYDSFFHEQTGEHYHYVITKQGDACCLEGLEFIWNGEHTFPDDYPASGTPIEIYGVFSKNEGEGFRYFYLAIDDINIIG